ncbi:MAG: circadian clock KaiB family protein [Candidatus Acidiferrales bacterium]
MAKQKKKIRRNRKARKPKETPATKAYLLQLYITGQSTLSSSSVRNLLQVCQSHLGGRYEIQVIDICQQPELAREAQIIATPTLVKAHPAPFRKFVGNLSNQQQLLAGLGIRHEKRPN